MAPNSSSGPFPPSLVHSFGPEGDVIGTPPLPVGRFIRAPHRRVAATPALQEAGPSEGQASPPAHAAAGLPLAVVRNISLTSGPAFAMPVAPTLTPADGSEQSVATNGRGLVLYTTNTKDAFSVNGGRSFSPLDPSTVFPTAAGGFCCDQVVTYVPSVDRFVWVLQYSDGTGGAQDSTQPNVIRVATATSASFLSCNAGCWSYYDWTPADLGAKSPAAGKTVTLDRPHVAFSANMLSLTAAIGYNPGGKVYGSVIWRFPLAQLGKVIYPSIVPVQAGSLPTGSKGDYRFTPAQNNIFNNPSSQYFASRQTTSRLNLVQWLDRDPSPVFYEVDVPSIATQNNGGPTDAAPSGSDWAARYTAQDGVVVTGARTGRVVWFGWNAGRDAPVPSGGIVHVHDQPAVEFVGIDVATLLAVDYDSIEFANAATVIPQLRTNGEGELGVDFMFGGPTINPTYAVGYLRRDYAAVVAIKGGAADPTGLGTSGDFLGLAADPGQMNCFVAAGSAIKYNPGAGTAPAFLNLDPHYVVFGRQSHCTVPPTTLSDLLVTSVKQNGAILSVLGTLKPPVSTHVKVIYTPPHGAPFTHTVLTDAQGNFSDTATIGSDQVGPWQVTAGWFGEGQYIGSQSGSVAVTATPPGPAASTLTLSCPSGTTTVSPATFTVSGSLTPAVDGSTVVVRYTPSSGPDVVHTVQTAANGSYSDSITVYVGRLFVTWTVQAHFAGDAARTSADAPTCTFSPQFK
jgi:hypothetical protein